MTDEPSTDEVEDRVIRTFRTRAEDMAPGDGAAWAPEATATAGPLHGRRAGASPHRSRSRGRILAVAAAVLLLAGVATVGVLAFRGDGPTDRTGPSDQRTDESTDEDAASPDESLEGITARDILELWREEMDTISVVDALTPYDAESQAHETLLHGYLQQYEAAEIDDCLEARGVPRFHGGDFYYDADFIHPPTIEELSRRGRHPDFPALDHLEREGFGLPEGATGGGTPTAEQREAMDACGAEYEPLIEIRSRRDQTTATFGAWWGILEEVDDHPDLEPLREDFASCALAEGIDPQFATDEDVFINQLDGLAMQEWDSVEDHVEALRERGRIYVSCGRELWERKIELRLERRDDFLDEHWDEIVELSQGLHEEGLIAAPLTDADREQFTDAGQGAATG